MSNNDNPQPMIGVFDSGVGGLSVWREIVEHIPAAPTVYLADQAHIPYGGRSLDEVRTLTVRAAEWLIARGCSMIVVACNTASSAALEALRAIFPTTPFVGMEPAIKPAARHTQTGVVGMLATPATLHSSRYAGLVARWAHNLRIIEQPCLGWVEAVEGLPERASPSVEAELASLVDACVMPLLEQHADALVLGCTHFLFLQPWIKRTVEGWCASRPHAHAVMIFDPAPAVARRAHHVWSQRILAAAGHLWHEQPHPADGIREFWTTGSADRFARVASALLGCSVAARSLTL